MSYAEFFLNSQASVKKLLTFEISHPNFSQAYYLVQNQKGGITATLEDSSSQDFVYRPVQIKGLSSNETLDQSLEIQLGDLGKILPMEFDRVQAADGFGTKPTVIFRSYRSDDLSAPLEGPFELQVTNFSFSADGSVFDATAQRLNISSTGLQYTFDAFPMLRGFL